MPTLTIDPLLVVYQERADLDYSWEEEGENYLGFPSHNIRPGYGAQWDPTRGLSAPDTQFAVYGWRAMWGAGDWPRRMPYLRRLPVFEAEGPHDTNAVLLFQPPLGRVTLTDARLRMTTETGTSAPVRTRFFAAAVDDFVSRCLDAATGYPLTYRAEYHQRTWGAPRRYRVDSCEFDMPHTANIVRWEVQASPDVDVASPDLAPVLNEVLLRPNWRAGNRVALVFATDMPIEPPVGPYAPAFETLTQQGGPMFPPARNLRLSLTY